MSTEYIWAVFAYDEWWLHVKQELYEGYYKCKVGGFEFFYHDLAAPVDHPPMIGFDVIRLSRDEAQAIIASARAKEALGPSPAP